MNVESGLQLGELLGIVKRRASLAAGVAAVVFLTAYWIAMALPNQYESYATILVEPQTISDRLIEAGVAESDLNNRLHLMTAEVLSRPRLSRIIDEFKLYGRDSGSSTREEIIDVMRGKISVVPVLPELESQLDRRSRGEVEINTFQILFTGNHPETAARVAQRLANDFIEEHIDERVQVSQKSLEFIDAERRSLAARLEAIEQQIAEVKATNPGRLPEDLFANQRLLERAISDLRAAERQLDVARGDAAFWANQMVAASVSGASNDDANPTRRLSLLELKLATYRSMGYTDSHPDVIQVNDEIAEIEAQLDAEAEKDEDRPASFAEQSAGSEKQRAALRAEAAEAEIERLKQQRDTIQAQIAATPRVAEQIDTLEREYEALKRAESDFARRAQEAAVQADLERRQLGEQFRILESAFPSPAPSSPNRMLILLVGLFLGVGFGAGAGIVAESSDSSVHGARQLQSQFGLPVLVSIPLITLESDLARRARSRLRTSVAVAALVVFCLIGGAATYLVVNGTPRWVGPGDAETPATDAARGAASQSHTVG